MADDREIICGKWSLKFKNWTWEYLFTADGRVTWRDPLNGEKGTGRWAKHGNLINVTWFDSTTTESFRCPINPDDQSGWYNASYGVGPSKAKKMLEPVAAPVGVPVNPAIANVSWDKYVDQFVDAKYDMNYKIPHDKSFAYSNILQLKYGDGASIEIDFKAELQGQKLGSVQARDALAMGYLGAGGRIFPKILAPDTVPRLWTAKDEALADQNDDFKAFATVAVTGVAWVLSVPAMPAGLPPAAGAVRKTRVPGLPKGAGGALSEAELTAINAIRQHPEYAKLTVEEVAALRSYTGENFGKINLALRGGGGGPQAQAEANALISGLKKLPGYSGKLARSESMQVDEAVKMYKANQTFKPDGVLSTTRGAGVASREGNVAITVKAIGKAGKDVSKASAHVGESEVIFPPGTSFFVETVTPIGQAVMVVLREL